MVDFVECAACHKQTLDYVAVNNDGICNDCQAGLDRLRLAKITKEYYESRPVILLRKPEVKIRDGRSDKVSDESAKDR